MRHCACEAAIKTLLPVPAVFLGRLHCLLTLTPPGPLTASESLCDLRCVHVIQHAHSSQAWRLNVSCWFHCRNIPNGWDGSGFFKLA